MEGFAVVGEVVTDVAHVGCPKQGIADGMNQHIGIAMPEQSQRMLEAYATQPQFASLYKLVDVIAETNTKFHDFTILHFTILRFYNFTI